MSLKQQLADDLKTAMKARDAAAMSAIRLLKSEITKLEIQIGRDADDADICKLVEKALKQRRESIEIYRKAAREDLAEREEAEAAVLTRYQPKQLTQEELDALISEAIAETGAVGIKQLGAVMKLCMAKAAGRADGKTVSGRLKERLAALGN